MMMRKCMMAMGIMMTLDRTKKKGILGKFEIYEEYGGRNIERVNSIYTDTIAALSS